MPESETRVVVAMPSGRHIPAQCTDSFAGVYGRGLMDGVVTAKMVLGDTYLPTARNMLVGYAQQVPTEPTHVMWIDDDMVMDPDVVARLAARNVPIVGGLYHKRAEPYEPVAFNFAADQWAAEFIELPDDPKGLIGVEGLGLGCTLVRMDVYRRMHEYTGDLRYHHVALSGRGEDLHFFSRCKEMGIPVYLDCDVRCGHVRDETVATVHYESYRAAQRLSAG